MKELLKHSIVLEPDNGIYSVKDLEYGDYDTKAVFYDKVMSNSFYNRLMWGNSPAEYTRFARESINKNDKGTVIDIGCGPLSFTHEVYNTYSKRELVLSDLSLEMLKLGKKRLLNNDKMKFLRADAMNFPFNDETVQSILSFGFLHVINQPEKLLQEFYRLLKPGGDLHLSCLCTDRKTSNRYLNFLKKRGLVSLCLKAREIQEIINNSGFTTELRVIGGMAYINALKNS